MASENWTFYFGTIAVKNGFVNYEQVYEALDIQKKKNQEGQKHVPIGAILLNKGYMDASQVNLVMEEQKKSSL